MKLIERFRVVTKKRKIIGKNILTEIWKGRGNWHLLDCESKKGTKRVMKYRRKEAVKGKIERERGVAGQRNSGDG